MRSKRKRYYHKTIMVRHLFSNTLLYTAAVILAAGIVVAALGRLNIEPNGSYVLKTFRTFFPTERTSLFSKKNVYDRISAVIPAVKSSEEMMKKYSAKYSGVEKEPKTEEKPESEEASLVEKAENTDGFIPVNAEEVPFEEDADFMEELQEELEDDTSDSEVEAAKKFVCDFGVFKGKTMEQVMESGVKGTETMKWIVNKYKGPNKELVKAAKTLLDYQSESEELRAA
mgnify:CR=1 FL=1